MKLPASKILGHHANSAGHCLLLAQADAEYVTAGDWLEVAYTPSYTARYLAVAVERHRPVCSVLVGRH